MNEPWTLEGASEVVLDDTATEVRRKGAMEVLAGFPNRVESVDALAEILENSHSTELREQAALSLLMMSNAEASEVVRGFEGFDADGVFARLGNLAFAASKRADHPRAEEIDPAPFEKARAKSIEKVRKNEKSLQKLLRDELDGSEAEAPEGEPDFTIGGYGLLIEIRPAERNAAPLSLCVGEGTLWCEAGVNSCSKKLGWNTRFGRGIQFHAAQFYLEQIRQGKYMERVEPVAGGEGSRGAIGRIKLAMSAPDYLKSSPDVPDFDEVPESWDTVEYEPYGASR